MRFIARRRGFTLIELLVVVAIMIGIMAMGSLAMADFFSQGNFNLGIRAVTNGIRAARQHSVSMRRWVFLELVDTDETGEAGPDYVEIMAEEPEVCSDTGMMYWRYPDDTQPVERVELPRNIHLDISTMDPAGADLGGPPEEPDRNLIGKKGIEFYPSGASRPVDGDTNVLTVTDLVSGDTAKIYIYTVTSFVKVRITYHWEEP